MPVFSFSGVTPVWQARHYPRFWSAW